MAARKQPKPTVGKTYSVDQLIRMSTDLGYPVLITHVWITRRLSVSQVWWPGETRSWNHPSPGDAIEEILRRGWPRCMIVLPQQDGMLRAYPLKLGKPPERSVHHG